MTFDSFWEGYPRLSVFHVQLYEAIFCVWVDVELSYILVIVYSGFNKRCHLSKM